MSDWATLSIDFEGRTLRSTSRTPTDADTKTRLPCEVRMRRLAPGMPSRIEISVPPGTVDANGIPVGSKLDEKLEFLTGAVMSGLDR